MLSITHFKQIGINLKKIKIEARTDNLDLVRRVKKKRQNNPPTMFSKHDSDIMSGVSHGIEDMKVERNSGKGHQDAQGKKFSS